MRRVLAAVVLVLACGCGSDEQTAATTAAEPAPPPPPPATAPPPAAPEGTTTLSVYFLRDGKIAAASRTVPETTAVARAALEALIAGPTAAEREAGLTTSVAADLRIEKLAVAGGVARADFAPGCPAIAQVVYTLTQFPTVERVAGDCIDASAYPNGLGRADLEDVTPAILVESPTVGEEARSPLRIRGTANTFEAVFVVNVTDWDGRIVAEQVVTATSGSGDRGTFDVTVPFAVGRPGGALIAFERSAEDGSQLHVVEIPLALQPG